MKNDFKSQTENLRNTQNILSNPEEEDSDREFVRNSQRQQGHPGHNLETNYLIEIMRGAITHMKLTKIVTHLSKIDTGLACSIKPVAPGSGGGIS
jgi:hypothetical protein